MSRLNYIFIGHLVNISTRSFSILIGFRVDLTKVIRETGHAPLQPCFDDCLNYFVEGNFMTISAKLF